MILIMSPWGFLASSNGAISDKVIDTLVKSLKSCNTMWVVSNAKDGLSESLAVKVPATPGHAPQP